MERIGLAALEDDGIYFAVAVVDPTARVPLTRMEATSRTQMPPSGYTKDFIKNSIRSHFAPMVERGEIGRLGISTFGLVDLDEKKLLKVPRWDWRDTGELDFRTLFKGLPIYVAHDSSSAAVGEWLIWRKEQLNFNPKAFVRIRIGTGVGVGCVNSSGLVRQGGRSHPEAGHLPVRRTAGDAPGTCQAHSHPLGAGGPEGEWDCIEGLISEQAILRRCNAKKMTDIPSEHPVWETVADSLATLCYVITILIAPDLIVIGGRTMIDRDKNFRMPVLNKIHKAFENMRGRYPDYNEIKQVSKFIRASSSVKNPATASLLGLADLAWRDGQPAWEISRRRVE